MFETARVRTYVTALIEHAATDRLRAEVRLAGAGSNAAKSSGVTIGAGSPPVASLRCKTCQPAESVAALRQMLIMTANVRRNGERLKVPAEELVPGDIVGFEAGDKVPADGRLLVAATLEIEEAGLTGESTPSAKQLDHEVRPSADDHARRFHPDLRRGDAAACSSGQRSSMAGSTC